LSDAPVRKILKKVGLTEKETDVYVFLAKHDALKGAEIAKLTSIDKAETYRILRSLQNKGLLEATLEAPTRFLTFPFDKVLDSFIRSRRDEASFIESAKNDLLSDWAKISKSPFEVSAEKFTVIEGESKVYARIFQLIKEAKNQLSVVLTVSDLLKAERFGLFDASLKYSTESIVRFRFLTEISEKNAETMKMLLRKVPEQGFDFAGRIPDLGLHLSPRMVVRDCEEILFFITSKREKVSRAEKDEVCLWTNCKTLVQSFAHVFEEMWNSSTDIDKKIVEIETGKPPSQMHLVFDAAKAKEKYYEALKLAEEEVIIMTSSKGLMELLKDNEYLRRLKKTKRVPIKIMAPIICENYEFSKQLSEYCEVRHVPESYLTTILIDRRSLFQFKNPESSKAKSKILPPFENSFYSDYSGHVEKAKTILNSMWKNSQELSAIKLESTETSLASEINPLHDLCDTSSFAQALTRMEEHEMGTITEKDVIDKIINAERVIAKDPLKDVNVQYGSYARAVIHPPSHFNLPDMMIHVWHCNKQSSWGAEDWLDVFLWLETSKGYAYVPVAHITDNPRVVEFRKGVWAGTPAAQNINVVRKSMLQVRVQGNTLFAGWTMPIPLYPIQYSLPPACILFEGYGKVKTGKTTTSLPSGKTQVSEFNSLEAFVTFLHPSSKYSGPGTDGVFNREHIMTAFPPSSK